ncbi:MAG: alpha/beta hydrolase [Rhodococcus sp.]|nr:alpha/beta hydrolase [Rhodococcus sp. (in: high G+C Gram-positive bacteria)]
MDRFAGETFTLRGRDRVVTTDDGVDLAIREVGPADAPLTAVFVHGFCNRMEGWYFQRQHLEAMWGDTVRLVFYDHRGHGRSGRGRRSHSTIPQLARDLNAVIDAVAPEGPIVLVGHSMGGMAVLSYAGQFPDSFGDRVVGVALVSTSAGALSEAGMARNLGNPVVTGFRVAAQRLPRVVQGGRGATRRVLAPMIRSASFGTRRISPTVARFSDSMINDTSLDTLVNFLPTFEQHDETAALPVLTRVPTLVLCGSKDLITPIRNSRTIAEQLPDATVLRVPGAGHMVQLECPELVSDALDDLFTQAIETLPGEPDWTESVAGFVREQMAKGNKVARAAALQVRRVTGVAS